MLKTENIPDNKLTAAIQNSDANAFKLLYFRYHEAIFRYALRRTGEYETARDLTQDVFARLWHSRKNLDPGQSIKAYLYRTATNLAINHLKKKILRNTESLEKNENLSVESDLPDFETEELIAKALNALPKKERMIFALNRFEGLKYAEIADVLRISVKTVEKYMSRALKSLRLYLKDLLILWIAIQHFF